VLARITETGTGRPEELLSEILARGSDSSDRLSQVVQRDVSRQADAFAVRIDELEARIADFSGDPSRSPDVDVSGDPSGDAGGSARSYRSTTGTAPKSGEKTTSKSDKAGSGKKKSSKTDSGKTESDKKTFDKTDSGKKKSGTKKSSEARSGKKKPGKATRSKSGADRSGTTKSGTSKSGTTKSGATESGATRSGTETPDEAARSRAPVGASGVRQVPTRREDRVGE
jgi:hypothetical protein